MATARFLDSSAAGVSLSGGVAMAAKVIVPTATPAATVSKIQYTSQRVQRGSSAGGCVSSSSVATLSATLRGDGGGPVTKMKEHPACSPANPQATTTSLARGFHWRTRR